MFSSISKFVLILTGLSVFVSVAAGNAVADIQRPVLPVLALKDVNPVIRLDIKNENKTNFTINKITVSLSGTTYRDDIASVGICRTDSKGFIDTTGIICRQNLSSAPLIAFDNDIQVSGDSISLWIFIRLKDDINLDNRIHIACTQILVDGEKVGINDLKSKKWLRPGIALRQKNYDNINSCRIPGLATSQKGTLLAIYDARYDSSRDLQGDIDIALQRSFDGGKTWQPVQIIMDMGEWGGLPQKYNGVSDACILVDEVSGDIYVLGLWMHGVLDKETGTWVEGLNENSTQWTHQWVGKGSQPGFGVKQTSQMLLVKSSDDGATWSTPVNITEQVKRPEWWLFAPAPGHGITLTDGVLVFPTQGRDEKGEPFSNIMWSKDRGMIWTASNPAYNDVTECMAVQLSDGSIMLNMRDNRNKNNKKENGRRVCVTNDLGKTWTEHSTSRNALIEPTCMASIHKHTYNKKGKKKSILLFCNPNSRVRRDKITLKASFDDGTTWPVKNRIMLDEYRGWGYSCITSVDEKTIGVLYESSQADMVFQQIGIEELIQEKKNGSK